MMEASQDELIRHTCNLNIPQSIRQKYITELRRRGYEGELVKRAPR